MGKDINVYFEHKTDKGWEALKVYTKNGKSYKLAAPYLGRPYDFFDYMRFDLQNGFPEDASGTVTKKHQDIGSYSAGCFSYKKLCKLCKKAPKEYRSYFKEIRACLNVFVDLCDVYFCDIEDKNENLRVVWWLDW